MEKAQQRRGERASRCALRGLNAESITDKYNKTMRNICCGSVSPEWVCCVNTFFVTFCERD